MPSTEATGRRPKRIAGKPKTSPAAEQQRRKAIARWENEGGAGACGPQAPGGVEGRGDEERRRT